MSNKGAHLFIQHINEVDKSFDKGLKTGCILSQKGALTGQVQELTSGKRWKGLPFE